ncbi:Amidophosphoribosyltransferase [Elusimicrobium minutum Pei191]|uniref:Amidophosphoribosyltransferase n=1 Tax=Elusimicrobium minutum (strain Pei191) TaxID=445932 RepID=B2KDJ2_ELUMP|nr:amidophosphoribosyltransferase [Elusimicrobium minutum]ACC98588.1 Amidophosphoribosyltransferase [Elusimicrobium minutum Pei191]
MCGVFGVENNKDAANIVFQGLLSLQHRGQESAGIISSDTKNNITRVHRGMGNVSYVFKPEYLAGLNGDIAVGHVRYATGGKSSLENTQPFWFDCKHGRVILAHNGNIANDKQLAFMLQKTGAIFAHSSDSEHIMHMIEREKGDLETALPKALKKLNGAYALILLQGSKMIGVRDPHGIRSLVLGKLGKSYILTSETIAVELLGGKVIKELAPGEIITIQKGKIKKSYIFDKKDKAVCVFEQVYFSMPASRVQGQEVAVSRMAMGAQLARQMKGIKADIAMPVPDSGMFAALGFAKESGIDFEQGLVRNHYMGRSFIMPTQELREHLVKMKLFPIKTSIMGKKIVLVDDSLVRGTTSKKIVKLLKDCGAKEVHLALSAPKVISPCFYGIDTPTKKELMSTRMNEKDIAEFIGAESVTFIKINNMLAAVAGNEQNKKGKCGGYCAACFTGKYPTGLKV